MTHDEYLINYYNKQQEDIELFINNKQTIIINNFDEIKLNDDLIINFYPYSQKYVYTLFSKYGTVVSIDNHNNTEFLYNIELKNKNETYHAAHDWDATSNIKVDIP